MAVSRARFQVWVFSVVLLCASFATAKQLTFELVNDTKEVVSFALAKDGEDPDNMIQKLQEIPGKGTVTDKIDDTQRQILITAGTEKQLYIISDRPGKHFKLKFGPKSPFSSQNVLKAQTLAMNNISTKDIIMTKIKTGDGAWEDLTATKEAPAKKEETKKEEAKKGDAKPKSEEASSEEDESSSEDNKSSEEKEEAKKTVTAYQLLGATSSDDATKERQILGFGTALGKLTFDNAMGKKASAKGDQDKISAACKKLLDLWGAEGASKKERERIMKDKKVPEDEWTDLASDTHGLIEKTCEAVKEKFPTQESSGDDFWGGSH